MIINRVFLSSGSDSGGPFWVATYGNDIDNQQIEANGIAVDGNLNVYVGGRPNYFPFPVRVFKITKAGSLEWQYRPESGRLFFNDPFTAGGRVQGKTIVVDSSNNIYYRYKYDLSDAAFFWGSIKINPSATRLWENNYQTLPRAGFNAVDSAGNFYGVNSSTSFRLMVQSQSTGDGVNSFRLVELSGQFLRALSIAFSGTWGSLVGGCGDGAFFRQAITSGSPFGTPSVWRVDDGLGWSFLRVHDCAFDSNFNTIFIGLNGSPWGGWVASNPFLSAGISWTRSFANVRLNQVVVDSSGNVLVAGHTNMSSPDGAFIAKLNSSGTVQWQRRLTISGYAQLQAYNLATDSIGNIYIAMNGFTTTGNKAPIITAKLPSDGSLTGTYGNITYASFSATVNTTSFLLNITGESGATITSLTDGAISQSAALNTFVTTTETYSVVTLS